MRKIYSRVLALCLATLSFTILFAQKQITGTVTDEKQVPLAGATIAVKGTKVATVTDASGKFNLNVPANGKTLVVSFIGMHSQEVSVGDRSLFAVSLLPA